MYLPRTLNLCCRPDDQTSEDTVYLSGNQHHLRRLLQDMGGTPTESRKNINVLNDTSRHSEGSPVPYLIAGFVAMFALISFSVIVLTVSYWKLVGCVQEGNTADTNNQNGPSSQGEEVVHDETGSKEEKAGKVEEGEKVVVIMAGEERPTFIAKPTPRSTIVLDTG